MRIAIQIIRIITGLLFIFSGLVKAIDPRGLAYKMQEFFEAWANAGYLKSFMPVLNDHALAFSIIMITLEVVVGVAILLGWQRKFMIWVLLLLMLFFTFLTSYVLFSGKIKACGCFGDCIPITPEQTFTKDIILVLFSFALLIRQRWLTPVFKPALNGMLVLLALLGTLGLQWYVLRHLPVVDCLPFKKGNNIVTLSKMPENAIQDKFEYRFLYEKNGEAKEFTTDALPDSSWTFKERKQTLVMKGSNNVPLVNDFSFTSSEGVPVTDSILSIPGKYYLYFIRDLPADESWVKLYREFFNKAKAQSAPVFISTSHAAEVQLFFAKNNLAAEGFYSTDATAIKTAARTNPAALEMKGPVITNKKSWADVNEF
ncbi:MAG: BT_3928 family protein [Ferruginibacter sp.]